jgi:hypothetical protein
MHFLLGAGCLAAIFVFTAAFRFALRECSEPHRAIDRPVDIPRAAIHTGGQRWTAGQGRQRALHSVRMLQAGFVAMGITSVFVMALCMVGIVGLMIFG